MERGYPQNFINALSEVRFEQMSQALLQRNETKKPILPFITHYHPAPSSKSQRNLNEEVVPNTATTIAESNFQGAAHNIIQKRTLP